MELVEPGVISAQHWRPSDVSHQADASVSILAGVAQKP
ncbi:SAM-dependent methyltransferase [Frankia sp. AgPm24]